MMSAVDTLNRAFEADPKAIYRLLRFRTACNETLADDPTIVCGPANESFDGVPIINGPPGSDVGWLGLLNGVLTDLGLPVVAVKFSDEKNEEGMATLLGFVDYNPAPRTDHTTRFLIGQPDRDLSQKVH